MRRTVWIVVAALAALAACKEERSAPKGATLAQPDRPTLPTGPTAPTAAPDAAAGDAAHEEMLKSYAKKREILVGGCREDCGDPKSAFYNYIRAIAKKDAGKSAIPYLESSLMVHDGARRGDEWVALWRDMRLAERRESVERFAAETSKWVERVESPDALEQALASGVTFEEKGEGEALVLFRHPPLPGDDSAPTWRYRMTKRGWEWLVSEIDTR
jgi:hypothetical protein